MLAKTFIPDIIMIAANTYRMTRFQGGARGMNFSHGIIEFVVMLLFMIIILWSIYHFPIAFSGLLSLRRRRASLDNNDPPSCPG